MEFDEQTPRQQALEKTLRAREAGDDQPAEITVEQVIRIAQIISQTTKGGNTEVQLNAAWAFLTSVASEGLGQEVHPSAAEHWSRLNGMPIAVAPIQERPPLRVVDDPAR